MADVTYKQFDTSPSLEVTAIKNGDGTYMNLSGATAKLMMKRVSKSTLKVNITSTSTSLSLSTGSTSTGYNLTYAWSTSDLNTVGQYVWEVEFTLTGGGVVTLPNNNWYTLDVVDDLG